MTVNRLCEPESKLGVWDRWLNKVYLPSCQDLKLDQMYEAMDMLQAHSTAVEEAVFFRITLEDAASGYKSLLVIERCFRTLKSTQIKLTPMYQWLPSRIEAHIKICVLALLLARVAERQCQLPWNLIRDDLATLQITEFQTPPIFNFLAPRTD